MGRVICIIFQQTVSRMYLYNARREQGGQCYHDTNLQSFDIRKHAFLCCIGHNVKPCVQIYGRNHDLIIPCHRSDILLQNWKTVSTYNARLEEPLNTVIK